MFEIKNERDKFHDTFVTLRFKPSRDGIIGYAFEHAYEAMIYLRNAVGIYYDEGRVFQRFGNSKIELIIK